MRHIRLCLRVQDSPHLRAAVAALLLVGCADKTGDSGTNAADDSATYDLPIFAQVRDDVLVPSCGFGSCHGAGEAGLQIDEDMMVDALVDVPSTVQADAILVVPGDPDGSYLVAKLTEAPSIDGEVMPPSGAMSQERIDMVKKWIAAGAE